MTLGLEALASVILAMLAHLLAANDLRPALLCNAKCMQGASHVCPATRRSWVPTAPYAHCLQESIQAWHTSARGSAKGDRGNEHMLGIA